MGEWKRIALKGALLATLVVAMNFVYEYWLFPQDLKDHSDAGHRLWAVRDSSDILYLGESSDVTVADEDLEKLSISQFLQQYYPAQRLGAVSRGALHLGNYLSLLHNVPADSRVKTVVVTLNLRAFDATWINSKLETALQKEMTLLQPGPPLWRRLLLSLRNYEIKTAAQWAAAARDQWARDTLRFPTPFPYPTVLAWDSAIAAGTDRHDSLPARSAAETSLAGHYVKNFAFQIDPATNPRIHDLDRIVALAQARGWQLVLNLLPENMAQAERLVGTPLTLLMRQNRDLLVARYGSLPSVTLVDQLESLPTEDFLDQNWTTEHYFEHGRRAVADRLARAISPLLPGQMQVPAQQHRLRERFFFNDCEGQVVWSQMQTLDMTHAHSGQQACLTRGPKEQFGVTLSYPMTAFDTTALDSLHFSCWVYPLGADHNASIAWEAGGEQTGYLWDSIQLRRFALPTGRWSQIQFSRVLWPNLPQAEIVKVYPYNPSETAIWFDDIRILYSGKTSENGAQQSP